MPVLTRRRTTLVLIIAAASVPLLLAGAAALISGLIVQSCSGAAGADAASQVAQRTIPASFLAIYEQVGAQYKIPWEVLAGIGEEECDHGRNPDPSCTPAAGRDRRRSGELRGSVGTDADRRGRRVVQQRRR